MQRRTEPAVGIDGGLDRGRPDMEPRRLYRSRSERRLAGVAGGIAEYLKVDPTVVRVVWIISIFFMGIGFLLYIILAFVMPLEPIPPYSPPGPPPGAPDSPGAKKMR